MSNIYEMVFLSPIGTIGTRSYNDKISELRFIQNRPEIKPKNFINKELYVQLKFYFKKKLKKFDVPFFLFGSDYQKEVLKEVIKIPYGETISYFEIAKKCNSHPRPVGNVCKNNPLNLLIPCHRVVGKNNIGGFSKKGIKSNIESIYIKKILLDMEKQQSL